MGFGGKGCSEGDEGGDLGERDAGRRMREGILGKGMR